MVSQVFVESLESRMMLSAASDLLVAVPNIVVQGQSVVIPNGDAAPSREDFTDFGSMSTSGGKTTRRYVIMNTGDAPLSISTLKIVGVSAADFRITQAPTADIAPGAEAAVVVRFKPLAAGKRNAAVVIRSNDPSIPTDTFAIRGKGLITTNLPDGLQYATTVAGVGRAVMVGDGVKVNYTGMLRDGTVFDSSLNPGRTPFIFRVVGGTDPTKMQVIRGWDEGLQGMRPGEHRTLIIPPSLGYGVAGSGSIPANATLVFEVTFLGYPYLNVLGPSGLQIPSGTTTVRGALGTQFGTTTQGHSVSRTFLLQTDDSENRGLGLSAVNFSGTQAGQFTWSNAGYDSVLGGWPVTITYRAMKVGSASVTVSIPNTDPNHPNYTFAIHAQTTA